MNEKEINDFLSLVGRMRALQKKYFKNRLSTDLRAACALEKEVDVKLKQYGEQKGDNTTLF